MTDSTIENKITLWIWPSGLFPCRLIYYFRAKGLTLSVLKQHGIQLVPIVLASSPPALQSMEGFETRPVDSSLPIMRIRHADGRTTWIRESLSILVYLEDVFPASAGWPELRGENAEQVAQGSDILCLLVDATHWSLVELINSNSSTTSWSGLKEEEMSASTATYAANKVQFYLTRLEQWLEADKASNAKGTSLAGLALLAQVEYYEMMYGMDWLCGHRALRQWVENTKRETWYVSNDGLKTVEQGEGWATLLGE